MAHRAGYGLFWIGLSILLAACASAPTPLPSAAELLEQSARVMQDLRSVHFTIERSGAPAYVDPGHTFIFRRAAGDFVAPDAARATVRVIGPALVAEVSIVSLGDQYWETNPLTGQWASYPGLGYNPASLFNPATGLSALMRNDLTDVQLIGLEELEDLPGAKLFHLTAAAPGQPVMVMTADMIGRGRVTFEWWIEPDTYRTLRLRVVEPETDPKDPSVWVIDFDQFDADVSIEPPLP